MKITKRQLKRIIKKEKRQVIKEMFAANSSFQDEVAKIDDAVDMLFQLGATIEEIQKELRAIADELPTMDLGSHKGLSVEPDEEY
jgi:hypothetical protein